MIVKVCLPLVVVWILAYAQVNGSAVASGHAAATASFANYPTALLCLSVVGARARPFCAQESQRGRGAYTPLWSYSSEAHSAQSLWPANRHRAGF